MVFNGQSFTPMASVTRSPVLSIGGLAKRWLVPGWRVGWILFHDPDNRIVNVRKGIFDLTQIILGANSIIQHALPSILRQVPMSFFEEVNAKLEVNARLINDRLSSVPGLSLSPANAALYAMIRIADSIKLDDVQFMLRLLEEESVYVLPGSCFGAPGFFRVVFCAAPSKIEEACERIAQFCERHSQ